MFHLPQVVKIHEGKGTEAEYFGALVSCVMTGAMTRRLAGENELTCGLKIFLSVSDHR